MSIVGVVGLGVVGGTVARALEAVGERVIGYDRYLEIGGPSDLSSAEVVFLCVPTPSGGGVGHDLVGHDLKDLDGLIAVSRQQGQLAPVLTAIAEYNRAIRTSGDIEPVHGGETTRS